jgi:Xaa-Pro aminopeptidase
MVMNVQSILARSLFLAVNLSTILYSQELKYLVYDRDQIPSSAYHSRRDRLVEEIGNDAVAVFFSAPERIRNADTDYLYRQDDNFYYLTGCNEPNSILLLSGKGMAVRNLQDSTRTDTVREILFVQPRDVRREQWSGRRFGPEGAMKLLGIEHAVAVEKFKSTFPDIVSSSGMKFLYAANIPQETSGGLADWLQPLRSCIDALKSSGSKVELRDPSSIVRKFRIGKSPEEIGLITRAAHISAIAHKQAMMSCKPGMAEFELQAVYEYVFRRMGSEYPAYPSIVGAAENSVILHYDTNRRTINDGDIVLADCGAEYHNYASDLTRTYPANGRFSRPQRLVYQVVLDAQNAAIAMMKPGVLWVAVSAKADSVLENGLCALGIVKEKNNREFRKFFPHGLGHAVGLDVHDVNAPVMMQGMIYTIEPGIYIPENAQGVDPKYFNIGVRIEDDILVTSDGHELLSGEAPREIDDIEALMKQNGIGDLPID